MSHMTHSVACISDAKLTESGKICQLNFIIREGKTRNKCEQQHKTLHAQLFRFFLYACKHVKFEKLVT